MFNRLEYKKAARETLSKNWGIPCILSVMYLVLSTLAEGASPLISACVGGILMVALIFTLMEMTAVSQDSQGDVSFSTFLNGIELHWLNALLGSLWHFLWVFLWSLLFIIPGIVKLYSYSMMFFALAENPKIGATKAMDISKILTSGHKADLFLMDVSFLGWAVLSCLSFGIGFIWLVPYVKMTKTYAYYDLKRMAFAQSKLSPADFE